MSISILAAFSSSCGLKKKSLGQITKARTGEPLLLKLNDSHCEKIGPLSLHSLDIIKYDVQVNDSLSITKKVDLSLFSNSPNLKGEMIGATLSGGTFVNFEEETPSKNFRICKKQYPKNSLESATLEVISAVKKTKLFYQKLEHSKKIQKVEINMLPLLYQDSKNNLEVMTDNAFYSKGEENSYLVFLPQSKSLSSTQDIFSGKALYRFPSVVAHEYGHHIFHTHMTKSSSALMLLRKEKRINHLHKNNQHQDHVMESNSSTNALDAISEGVADLIAFYTYGKGVGTYSDITCFRKSRDLTHPTFYSFYPKVLTKEVLNDYFTGKKSIIDPRYYSDGRCPSYDFTGEHDTGAVLAYTLNLMSSTLAPNIKAKAELILKWLDLNNKQYLNDKSSGDGRVYLKTIMIRFFELIKTKLILENKKDSLNLLCQITKKQLPEYISDINCP